MPRRVLTRPAFGCRETHPCCLDRPCHHVPGTCFARMPGRFSHNGNPITPSILICFPLISVADMWEADEYKEACPTIPCPRVLPLT